MGHWAHTNWAQSLGHNNWVWVTGPVIRLGLSPIIILSTLGWATVTITGSTISIPSTIMVWSGVIGSLGCPAWPISHNWVTGSILGLGLSFTTGLGLPGLSTNWAVSPSVLGWPTTRSNQQWAGSAQWAFLSGRSITITIITTITITTGSINQQ